MSDTEEISQANRAADIPTSVADDVSCIWASTLYTQFCADSTEWCPHSTKQDLCLVGNYELLGDNLGKVGEVYITRLEPAATHDRDLDRVKLALESVANYAKSSVTSVEAESKPLPTSSSVS